MNVGVLETLSNIRHEAFSMSTQHVVFMHEVIHN